LLIAGSGESAVLLDPDTDDEQFNNNEGKELVTYKCRQFFYKDFVKAN